MEEPIDDITNPDEILSSFQNVGMIHNQIMDDVISDFDNQNDLMASRSSYLAFAEGSVVKNLRSKDLLTGVNDKDIRAQVSNQFVRLESFYNRDPSKINTGGGSILQSTVAEYEDDLNTEQKNLLLKIDGIIESAESTDALVDQLEKITHSDDVQNLDFENRYVIYAATSIGIESAQYWGENMNKWVTTLDESEDDTFDSVQYFSGINGRRVIGADIAGGIGGAVTGCMAGSLAAGVGCGPGAATGSLIGAAGGSTGSAVNQALRLMGL